MTPCLTFMWRVRLPFRVNLLGQYRHLKGLLSECRCMWPIRLCIRLNSFPHSCQTVTRETGHSQAGDSAQLSPHPGLCEDEGAATLNLGILSCFRRKISLWKSGKGWVVPRLRWSTVEMGSRGFVPVAQGFVQVKVKVTKLLY